MTSLPVSVTSGSVRLADYPPGGMFGPRLLTDYEFVWVIRGSARLTITESGSDGAEQVQRDYLLHPGMLALSPRGATDSYYWDERQPSTHAYVHFRIVESSPEQSWPVVRSMSALPVLDGCCRYLLQLAGDPSSAAATRRDQVIAMMADIFINGPTLGAAADPSLPDFMIAVADFVRRTWDVDGMLPVEVEDLAAAASVSPRHLFRLFRSRLGIGPVRALELIRLSRAAETLRRSNATLSEVAGLTGFANQYHFSRRFSSVYGIPPGSYRAGDDHDRCDPLAPLHEHGLLALGYRVS